MGLFDKKFCDICGDKVNLLTQKKLSDGQLCSDCKQKLGSFTSGWKQRTVQDVKAHLEQREQNKQKYQQFNCTAGRAEETVRFKRILITAGLSLLLITEISGAVTLRCLSFLSFRISGSSRNTEHLTIRITTVSPTTGMISTTDSLTIRAASAET